MKRVTGGVIMLGMMAVTGGFAKEYPLVTEGKTEAKIQMNPRPSAQEYRAAVELQEYVKKISGAVMNRSTYPAVFYRSMDKADFIEILPATLEYAGVLMPGAMREKLSEAKSDDAFYIKTDGTRILIIGKKPIGVLYGTYVLIEKYLGVRWFHPGEDGEYCPRSKNLTLGDIDDFQEPTVRGRYISCWTESVKPWTMEEVRIWQMRNKINFGSFYQYPNRSREELDFYACGNEPVGGGGHLTFEAAIPQKLFKPHPEWFPLKDGKRVCEERSQRCLSNPDVQQRVIDYVAEMAAYRAKFSISFHDSSFDCWCQCPACIKMGTYKGKFTVSNLAHRFTRLVADNVLARNPEADLSIDMYNVFRDLPTDPGLRYDSRVSGLYCPHQRCYVHRLNDPESECNTRFFKQMTEWRKRVSKIGIFDYYSTAHSPYAPMEYILAEDMKFYREIGLDHWIEDCTNKDLPMLSSNWPFYYVAARMLWDASLDVDTLMLEAYGKYYGDAAEPMKKYQAYRRELWEGAPGHVGYGGPDRINYCLTVPGAEKRLTGYLDEADKLAGGDAALKRRLAADRTFLKQFWVAGAATLKKVMSAQNDVPVRGLEGKVTVDGILDEEDWRKAPLVTGFLTAGGSEPVEETKVRILYDTDNWYIGIEAMTEHAWSALKSAAKGRDGDVWRDDAMEIFLAPPQADYYHWGINSAGTFYDAKLREAAFDSGAEIKTKVLKDRYVIEARIPAEPMGSRITDGQVWKVHVHRTCTNLQPPNTSENSSLDGTAPHNQVLFRNAVIGKNLLYNGNFSELIDTPKEAHGISSAKFPKGWGGSRVRLIAGSHNKNQVDIQGGLIYAYMQVPSSEKGNLISGTLMVSGKGRLKAWVSSCIRKPDDKRGFGHEIRHELGSWELTEKPEPKSFKLELAPYETGYLYVGVSGQALIDCISATRTTL